MIFTIGSKPYQVCKLSRKNRCKIGKDNFDSAPDLGCCASQDNYCYGYKLHAVASYSRVIHSFDMTKASVHDIHYLGNIKTELSNCTLIGDKAYLSKEVQLDLFSTASIELEVPMRVNQMGYKPQYYPFKKIRKRIETVFSQLDNLFMMVRNYAKNVNGLSTRILAKISALTVLQYINKIH